MIYVYTQPLCMPCKMAIKMIEESGVDYLVKDIRENSAAYEWVKRTGAQATPVITNSHETDIIIGFTPETKPRVQALIDAESAPSIYGEGTWLH